MRIIIWGSRKINRTKAKEIIENKIEELKPELIITSAETEGVCSLAREIAKNKLISLLVGFADTEKYHNGAYKKRAEELLKYGDYAILIHNGSSTGTIMEKNLLEKNNIKYEYILLEEIDKINMFDIENIKIFDK